MMKRVFILAIACVFQLKLSAQYFDMYQTDEPQPGFLEHIKADTAYGNCLQNWSTNLEWQQCNADYKEYWEEQIKKYLEQALKLSDAAIKSEVQAYHDTWLQHMEAQSGLFMDLYFSRKVLFGREQYLTYAGVVAAQYRRHALDLQTLVIYLQGE